MSSSFAPLRIQTLLHRHRKGLLRQSASDTTADYSNNGAAAFSLKQKKVYFTATPRNQSCPRPFNKVWDSFRALLLSCGNDNNYVPLAEEALTKLKEPMIAEYSDEMEFQQALFDSLQKCLTTYEVPQSDSNIIVLDLGKTEQFAVGIALHKSVAPTNNLAHDQSVRNNDSPSIGTVPVPDHVVCLCRWETNNWSVTDCFSVVKLETSDTTCQDFGYDEFDGEMLTPGLRYTHAALGQVTSINVEHTLLDHAKRGILGDHIPLAIIAARKEGSLEHRMETNQRLRWVSGRLEVPKAFGWGFRYSVQNFGQFSNDDDDGSVEKALSLYIETLLSGLVAAIRVQKQLAAGQMPASVPASGQSLIIGDFDLSQMKHGASPNTVAATNQDHQIIDRWSVSQGDVFIGKLDLSKATRKPRSYVDFRAPAGTSDVVIKVSSPVVHHLLIEPPDAYLALKMIKMIGTEELVNEISSVLYAVVYGDPGLVTVMCDLRKEGYTTLKPIDNLVELGLLWDGFQDLVARALLPMAELGIVHADIRPGIDVTSNILYKLETGKGGATKVTMKLIDFDSLTDCEGWNAASLDDRYIGKDPEWDATAYVWWQCMTVAFAWKEALSGNTLRAERSLSHMKKYLLDNYNGPTWLHKYRDRAKGEISKEIVKETLLDLAEEFSKPQELLPQLIAATKDSTNKWRE